jgi:hypothetical protein
MFNNDLEKILCKHETRILELEGLVGKLFVKNYFSNCPCCGGESLIPKNEAKSFTKLREGYIYYRPEYRTEVLYTTEEGYKNHLSAINEWAKEIKDSKI